MQAWQQPFLLFKETNKSNKFIAPEARCTLRRSFLSTTAKSASLCAASNVSLGQLRPHSYVHMLSLHTSHVHGSRPNFRACQIKHLTTAQVGQTENCLPTQPWHPNKQGQTKSPYRVCQISGQGSFKKSAEMTRIKANTITCIRPTWKQINPAQLPEFHLQTERKQEITLGRNPKQCWGEHIRTKAPDRDLKPGPLKECHEVVPKGPFRISYNVFIQEPPGSILRSILQDIWQEPPEESEKSFQISTSSTGYLQDLHAKDFWGISPRAPRHKTFPQGTQDRHRRTSKELTRSLCHLCQFSRIRGTQRVARAVSKGAPRHNESDLTPTK